ncbi:hypothetical protein LCGC14_2292610 [marine sediment metagenome]|uniref:Uncharacterized protein n=1 Tax=marine sediment metagenome TaxID=412755 RepID=A0A0F9DDD7_9ZZZZ
MRRIEEFTPRTPDDNVPISINAYTIGQIPIDIVAQSIGDIAIDIAAQSVGNLDIDIAAQSVGNLDIDIAAQSVGLLSISLDAYTIGQLPVDIIASSIDEINVDITAQSIGDINIDINAQNLDRVLTVGFDAGSRLSDAGYSFGETEDQGQIGPSTFSTSFTQRQTYTQHVGSGESGSIYIDGIIIRGTGGVGPGNADYEIRGQMVFPDGDTLNTPVMNGERDGNFEFEYTVYTDKTSLTQKNVTDALMAAKDIFDVVPEIQVKASGSTPNNPMTLYSTYYTVFYRTT